MEWLIGLIIVAMFFIIYLWPKCTKIIIKVDPVSNGQQGYSWSDGNGGAYNNQYFGADTPQTTGTEGFASNFSNNLQLRMGMKTAA